MDPSKAEPSTIKVAPAIGRWMAPSPDLHVLLVDDEEDILRALEAYLAGALPNVTVHTATSGLAALQTMKKVQIDLLLSDYKMPEMDGLELLSRARTLIPDVPRVLMTAFPEMELAILALNDGRIQHFFTKPLEPDMVRDVVKALVEERRARRLREVALRRSLEQMKRRRPDA